MTVRDPFTLDDMRSALLYISPEDRDVWRQVGMGLKAEFGELAFDVWDVWSQSGSSYKAIDARTVWKSMRKGGVTLGTVVHLAMQAGWKPEHKELSAEERKRLNAEAEERRARRHAEIEADEARLARLNLVVANASQRIWNEFCKPVGQSAYLGRKQVQAHGVRFLRQKVLISIDDNAERVDIWTGAGIKDFFDDLPRPRPDHLRIAVYPANALIIPMVDIEGFMWAFQVIDDKGEKLFPKYGRKSGCFHVLGNLDGCVDKAPIAFAEGYATAASVFEALRNTPVVFSLDSGNLIKVTQQFRRRYQEATLLICGDDDKEKADNPGRTSALTAASRSGAIACFPLLPDGVAGKDWNDLHVASGLKEVCQQIINALPASGAADSSPEPSRPLLDKSAPAPEKPAAKSLLTTGAGGEEWTDEKILQRFAMVYGETKVFDVHRQQVMKFAALTGLVGKKMADAWKNNPQKKQIDPEDVDQLVAAKGAQGKTRGLVERYVLLHGTAQAWDMDDKKFMTQAALKMALGSSYAIWENSPDRRVIRADNLVFNPRQTVDPSTHINTFTGLPMKPANSQEKAQPILDLLFWLVNDDMAVYEWMVKWLAYPLQNIGAKMRTAMLVHGRNQGAGKSLFFGDVQREIYGMEYGAVVGQHQLDGNYTEWRSKKLYCVFEEIFSNATKYSHMGTVKHMITGTTQRIEKKFVSGWEEDNHMNVVFLSNENQPLPVEPNDRRLLVIWPERKLLQEITDRVKDAIANGGIEAWYRYLLDQDLRGFTEFTEPPMTDAKRRLIDYGLPSWEVFMRDWQANALHYPYTSCKTDQLYVAYKQWCHDAGEGSVLSRNKLTQMLVPFMRRKENVHYLSATGSKKGTFFIIGEPDEGMTNEKWLGDCVDKFERSLGKNA